MSNNFQSQLFSFAKFMQLRHFPFGPSTQPHKTLIYIYVIHKAPVLFAEGCHNLSWAHRHLSHPDSTKKGICISFAAKYAAPPFSMRSLAALEYQHACILGRLSLVTDPAKKDKAWFFLLFPHCNSHQHFYRTNFRYPCNFQSAVKVLCVLMGLSNQ